MKIVYFDMDGTLADFFGVDGWLDDLMNHSTRPYAIAEPLFAIEQLESLAKYFMCMGYSIGVISWCSKENDRDFDREVRKVKRQWLKENFPHCDKIHIVKYGTPKWQVAVKDDPDEMILVDDTMENLIDWQNHGGTPMTIENMSELIKMIQTIKEGK